VRHRCSHLHEILGKPAIPAASSTMMADTV
jgi:hypothetical protein